MFGATSGVMDPRPLEMSPNSLMQTNGGDPSSKSLGMDLLEIFQAPALNLNEVLWLTRITFTDMPSSHTLWEESEPVF